MARLYGSNVSAEGVAPEPLRPAPMPGSTFVRPQHVQTGDNAARLADALQGLNGNLLQFGAQAAAMGRDPNSQENKDFANSLYGKSADELAALNAQPGYRNRIQQDALSSILGVKTAEKYQQDTQKWVGTEFDQANGDLQSELTARNKAILDSLPNDAARAAFVKATDGFNQSLVSKDIGRKVGEANAQLEDGVLSQFHMVIQQGSQGANPWSPEKIADEIVKTASANKKFGLLGGPATNALLYSLAEEEAAKGNTELARAILNHPRNGVGPLSGTSDYATKSVQLIAHSEEVKRGLDAKSSLDGNLWVDTEVNKGAFTADKIEVAKKQFPALATRSPDWWAAQVNQSRNIDESNRSQAIDAMTKDAAIRESNTQRADVMAGAVTTTQTIGGAAALTDKTIVGPTGNPVTITVKEQKDFAIAQIEKTSDEEIRVLVDGGVPEAEARARVEISKLNRYSGAGLVDEKLQARFHAIPIIMSQAIASKGETPREVSEAAELYRKLYVANPKYVDRLLSGDPAAEKFFEKYRVAMEDGNYTPQQAIAAASNPAPVASFSAADLSNAAGAMRGGGWFGIGNRLPGWEPNATDEGTIKSLAQTYSGQGLTASAALAKAADKLASTSVVINGRLVRSNDKAFPNDFTTIVPKILDQYAAAHTDDPSIKSGADLTVVSDGADRWHIVYKDSGAWVLDGAQLTPQALQQYRQSEADKVAQQQAAASIAAKQQGPAMAWIQSNVLGQKPAVPTPEAAKTYLADQARADQFAAFVKGEAQRKGMVQLTVNGKPVWVDANTRDIVTPAVKWSDPLGALKWAKTGTKYKPGVAIVPELNGYIAKPAPAPAPAAPAKPTASSWAEDRAAYEQSMKNVGFRGDDLVTQMESWDRNNPKP